MSLSVQRRDRDRVRGGLAVPASSLVVPALAGLGGVAFLAWKPGVARSMVGSPRAVGFTLVIAVLVLGAGWLLPRLGRGGVATALTQAVPVVLAFVVTVLPAFRDVTVVEAFPGGAAGNGAAVVDRAELHGIDHHARGDVLLVARSDGSLVVRFESLDVEPGPDYQVHLVPGADRESPGGGTHLAGLRGNQGPQNYPVPPTASTVRPVTVLIWCRAFAVPVAAATLR